MSKGQKITLFLADGLPKGVREVVVDQWSGRAICGPRNKVDDILSYSELDGPCLYFLIGEPQEGGLLQIYVGEADPFNARVKDHLRKKDWWQHVVVFAGNNHYPNKTGIQYLETRCVAELTTAARCDLANGNTPTLPSIPREDVPGLENFLEKIALIMPLLGYDVFETQKRVVEDVSNRIYCKSKDADAVGVLLGDGKVRVLKNSLAKKENAKHFNEHHYRKIKDELVKIGRLVDEGKNLMFAEDYLFDSMSAAAAVVLARSAQGPKEWKNKDGLSLMELEERGS